MWKRELTWLGRKKKRKTKEEESCPWDQERLQAVTEGALPVLSKGSRGSLLPGFPKLLCHPPLVTSSEDLAAAAAILTPGKLGREGMEKGKANTGCPCLSHNQKPLAPPLFLKGCGFVCILLKKYLCESNTLSFLTL